MSTILTFYYKTTDFTSNGKLCNNNIFFIEEIFTPLYDNLIDLNIIGQAIFKESVAPTNVTSYINEIATYYFSNVDNIGYIYSFINKTYYFSSGTIVSTDIVFNSGKYNGSTGKIIVNVIDNITREVVITIN